MTIQLKGVGWTEYDNIYVATDDNAYMGYACGFNTAGDVVINFAATGDAGDHIIDLYPGIYQGRPRSRSCSTASRSSPTPKIIQATRFRRCASYSG